MKGKKRNKMVITLSILSVLLIAFIIWTAWGNAAVELNTITVKSNKLPENFDGYRIAHISDLHNTELGKENGKLITLCKNCALLFCAR